MIIRYKKSHRAIVATNKTSVAAFIVNSIRNTLYRQGAKTRPTELSSIFYQRTHMGIFDDDHQESIIDTTAEVAERLICSQSGWEFAMTDAPALQEPRLWIAYGPNAVRAVILWLIDQR